jgi:hypothetical protein
MKKNYIQVFLALIAFVGLSYAIYYFRGEKLSYVTISINPEIQLAINEKDIVKEIISINEDADILLSDLDLIGKNIEQASDTIIESAIDTGYIDEYDTENTVVITVINEEEKRRASLEQKVINRVNNKFTEQKIYSVVAANKVTDELKENAIKYGVSNGKMLLVNLALSVNPDLKEEELVDLSVKEIQEQIKEVVSARHQVMKRSMEELRVQWKEEKEAIRNVYRTQVEAMKNTLLEDANVDYSEMTFKEKDEAVSNILKDKKEKIKDEVEAVKEQLQNQSDNYPNVGKAIKEIREQIRQGKKEK